MKMLRGLCALGVALMFSMSGFVSTAQAEKSSTAIMRVVMALDIKDDEHIDSTMSILIKKETADKFGITESEMCESSPSGTPVTEGDYIGCRSVEARTLSEVAGLSHEDGKYILDLKAGGKQGGLDLGKA
ncbi:MAG: hypothetical protein ACRCWS_03765, partial [Propionibacteriaceae bacterium]